MADNTPMINIPVYRNEKRSLVWSTGPHGSARPGRIVIDAPAHVYERYGEQLVRIDEDGRIPLYDLRHMRLEDARLIAEYADTDDVDGSSKRTEILDALAPADDSDSNPETDPEPDTDTEDTAYETQDPEETWRDLEAEREQSTEEQAAAILEDMEG